MRAIYYLFFMCCLLFAFPAHAQGGAPPLSKEEKAEARMHVQRAQRLFGASAFAEAYEELKIAYRIAPVPDLLFNMAKVAMRLELNDEAVEYLERYLRERPDAPDSAAVREQLEKLKKDMEKDEPVETPPPAVTRPAPPPPAVVPPPQPARVPPPPPPPAVVKRRVPWHGIGLMGGGAVLLAVGIGLGAGAASAGSTVEQAGSVSTPPPFDANLQSTESRGKALQVTGVVFDVLGAAALGAGGVITVEWYLRNRKSKVEASLRPFGAGLALAGSF